MKQKLRRRRAVLDYPWNILIPWRTMNQQKHDENKDQRDETLACAIWWKAPVAVALLACGSLVGN